MRYNGLHLQRTGLINFKVWLELKVPDVAPDLLVCDVSKVTSPTCTSTAERREVPSAMQSNCGTSSRETRHIVRLCTSVETWAEETMCPPRSERVRVPQSTVRESSGLQR